MHDGMLRSNILTCHRFKTISRSSEVMTRDVLAIEQKAREDITLDSLDTREEYIKPEPVEQIVNIHVGREQNNTTKIGSFPKENSKRIYPHIS